LILSTTGTWSSRLETEEDPNSGTSINNPTQSELDTTTNLGISRAQEEPMTCKSGVPTQDGGKSSSSRTTNSSIGKLVKFLRSKHPRMKKAQLLEFSKTTKERTKCGMLSMLIRLTRFRTRE
jgi:hypothetical protein